MFIGHISAQLRANYSICQFNPFKMKKSVKQNMKNLTSKNILLNEKK